MGAKVDACFGSPLDNTLAHFLWFLVRLRLWIWSSVPDRAAIAVVLFGALDTGRPLLPGRCVWFFACGTARTWAVVPYPTFGGLVCLEYPCGILFL